MIKTLSSKISAMIGMGIALVSLGFFTASLIYSLWEPIEVMGVDREEWMRFFGVIAAGVSMVLYVIDAVYCVIRFFMKIDRVLNGILTLLILGGIPIVFSVNQANLFICFSSGKSPQAISPRLQIYQKNTRSISPRIPLRDSPQMRSLEYRQE